MTTILKRFPLPLFIAITSTFCGCANWATRNAPVTFVPEVLKAIEAAPSRPIQLTNSQRDQLFASLHGPVRRMFLSDSLEPEVLASWWYRRDCVTFVRSAKDKNGFVFVTYLPNGQLFGSGGGTSGEPPWTL